MLDDRELKEEYYRLKDQERFLVYKYDQIETESERFDLEIRGIDAKRIQSKKTILLSLVIILCLYIFYLVCMGVEYIYMEISSPEKEAGFLFIMDFIIGTICQLAMLIANIYMLFVIYKSIKHLRIYIMPDVFQKKYTVKNFDTRPGCKRNYCVEQVIQLKAKLIAVENELKPVRKRINELEAMGIKLNE